MGTAEEWMSAVDYGHSLRGFGVNLLVRDVRKALPFYEEVLGVEVVHTQEGFAVLRHEGHEWMLHGDATYHDNPLLNLLPENPPRGAGVELRLYGIDPDAAEARARSAGFHVLQESQVKPHGLRECYLLDRDGYLWVPGIKADPRGG